MRVKCCASFSFRRSLFAGNICRGAAFASLHNCFLLASVDRDSSSSNENTSKMSALPLLVLDFGLLIAGFGVRLVLALIKTALLRDAVAEVGVPRARAGDVSDVHKLRQAIDAEVQLTSLKLLSLFLGRVSSARATRTRAAVVASTNHRIAGPRSILCCVYRHTTTSVVVRGKQRGWRSMKYGQREKFSCGRGARLQNM